MLTIFTVPADEKQRARALLTGGVLDQAVTWIADIATRGNAWSSSAHDWSAWVEDGEVVVEEDGRR